MELGKVVTQGETATRRRTAAAPVAATKSAALDTAADRALLDIGTDLVRRGYRFTTVTPASHARVLARPLKGKASPEDVFGWSRPFAPGDIPREWIARLAEAGELTRSGRALQSTIRFSTLRDQIFVHSAFPTKGPDATFFGPDTYRFARLIRSALRDMAPRPAIRILDIGAGSGAGGLHAAALAGASCRQLVLTDINPRALRFCRINARLNGIGHAHTVESDLFERVSGHYDLIISNPPYLVDPLSRLYRHGGGELGSALSLNIVDRGLDHLAPGGRLVLYTGSPIVRGKDLFHDIVSARLAARNANFEYEEIDPDVFGEELEHPPYDRADRIAVVALTVDVPRGDK